MVNIRFKVGGANSQIGGFVAGDRASVSEAFARHLVEEAGVAEYVTAQAAAVNPEKPAKTTRRKAKE